MKPYRLMILTASTGGGHDARADALAAWAREVYKEEIEVKILHPLESKGAVVGSFGVWLYNFIQRYAPVLHNIYFQVIEVIGDVQGQRFFGRNAYEKALNEFRPQMIVSLHDFLNKGYFHLAHDLLGYETKCATYCGEYSAGDGFSKHWVTSEADRWIGRTEGSLREAYRYGVEAERMDRFTFFLAPEEAQRLAPAPSRRALRLDNKKLTILFGGSRNGSASHMRYLEALEPYKDRVQVIVVCGLDERFRQAADAWQRDTGMQGIVEGYSVRMRTYLQLADVVLYKGGSNSATRAFYEACPMWIDGREGIMPQERLTTDFFVKNGGAEVVGTVKEFIYKVEQELQSGAGRLTEMRSAMQNLREKYQYPAPEDFFKEFFAWGFGTEVEAPMQIVDVKENEETQVM